MTETWAKLLGRFSLGKLTVDAGFLKAEVNFKEADREAAWDLYIELTTRIATQPLPDDHGDEAAALESLAQLFPITRQILREYGPSCQNVAKLAILVLNARVRPVTAKWHPRKLKKQLKSKTQKAAFRAELKDLQTILQRYTNAIGNLAGVETQAA